MWTMDWSKETNVNSRRFHFTYLICGMLGASLSMVRLWLGMGPFSVGGGGGGGRLVLVVLLVGVPPTLTGEADEAEALGGGAGGGLEGLILVLFGVWGCWGSGEYGAGG